MGIGLEVAWPDDFMSALQSATRLAIGHRPPMIAALAGGTNLAELAVDYQQIRIDPCRINAATDGWFRKGAISLLSFR